MSEPTSESSGSASSIECVGRNEEILKIKRPAILSQCQLLPSPTINRVNEMLLSPGSDNSLSVFLLGPLMLLFLPVTTRAVHPLVSLFLQLDDTHHLWCPPASLRVTTTTSISTLKSRARTSCLGNGSAEQDPF